MTAITATRPGTRAAEVADALAAFAGFITEHPELPLSKYGAMTYHVHGDTDEQQRAEIDRIAAILGVKPEETSNGTHYKAEREFGPGVTYEAISIDREAMKRYSAHMTPYFEAEQALANGSAAA
jgi:hypothetical protein